MSEQRKIQNEFIEKQNGFQFKDFIIRYIKYLPLVLIGLILSYFAAKIKLRYSTKMYKSFGTMLVKAEQGNAGAEKSVEDLFTSKSRNDLNTEMQIMKTRELMKRVVNKLHLNTVIKSKGKVKLTLNYNNAPISLKTIQLKDSSETLYLELLTNDNNSFTIKNGGTYNFNTPFNFEGNTLQIDLIQKMTPQSQLTIQVFPEDISANSFTNAINIKQVGDYTRLLELTMSSENPQLCVDVVNTLMKEYINMNKEAEKEVTIFTQKFIDERVTNLQNDLKQIENETRDFKQKYNSINISAQSQIYLDNLKEARDLGIKEQAKYNGTKYIFDNLLKDDNLKSLIVSGLIDDANLQNLILDYNVQFLQRQRDLDLENTTGGIQYTADSEKLAFRRKAILESMQKVLNSYSANISNYDRVINENSEKLKGIPGLENELLNFGRNQKIVEELYLFLKKKGEENGIKSAATLANTRIIDEALINNNPYEPVPKSVYGMFLFLGLLIPFAIAYLVEIFNNRIRFREDIQKQTNTPILAEVGHNETNDTLVVKNKSRKVIAEQFRMIRTNLQYTTGGKEKFTTLVTSTFSGEGKSFISTNIAAAYALSGKKTVLLEFDLRKPKVLEGLKMKKTVGISNYTVGKVTIPEIIRPVENCQNLYVIGSGAIPPNPAELLLEDSINNLFEYLKENFDIIVIDSAPVGLVTDSMMLSKFADATLYIVRHKYTLKKQIKLIDELYVNEKLPKMSIVINDVIGSTGGYYGYGGYGYGYGKKTYGYGTGYFEEEQKSILKDTWNKLKNFFFFWK